MSTQRQRYTDDAGERRETHTLPPNFFAMGPPGEDARKKAAVKIPDGYHDAVDLAIAQVQKPVQRSTRRVSDRFRVDGHRIMMACFSKNAVATGHDPGAFFGLESFSPSNVSRLVHVCKDCSKLASRRYIRKKVQPTLHPRKPAEPEFFVIEHGAHVHRCRNWEEVSTTLVGKVQTASAAMIVEGKIIPAKRAIAYERDH